MPRNCKASRRRWRLHICSSTGTTSNNSWKAIGGQGRPCGAQGLAVRFAWGRIHLARYDGEQQWWILESILHIQCHVQCWYYTFEGIDLVMAQWVFIIMPIPMKNLLLWCWSVNVILSLSSAFIPMMPSSSRVCDDCEFQWVYKSGRRHTIASAKCSKWDTVPELFSDIQHSISSAESTCQER